MYCVSADRLAACLVHMTVISDGFGKARWGGKVPGIQDTKDGGRDGIVRVSKMRDIKHIGVLMLTASL